MIITLPRDTLLNTLLKASRFASGAKTTSEAYGVFMGVAKEGLTVYGIQEARFFRELIRVQYTNDKSTVMSTDTKKLVEFLQALRGSDLILDMSEKSLAISSEKTKATFPVSPRESAPQLPQEKSKSGDVNCKVVADALPKVLYCTASDSARPTLSSVKFVPQEGYILLISTDGFRLSFVRAPLGSTIEEGFQLPATFLRDTFYSTLVDTAPAQLVVFGEGRVGFMQGDVLVGSQLVSGEFPPYERVLVRNFQYNCILDRKELIQAIKTISIFTREHSNIIVCEPQTSTMKIRPKKEAGPDNHTEIGVQMGGQDPDGLSVAFNYHYILDYLASVEDDFITMRINRADSPVLFLPGRIEPSEPHDQHAYQHIVMPVRIQE